MLTTFVRRDESGGDVDRVVAALDGEGDHDLALLAGTDVWYVELPLPRDYAGLYCFNLGVDGSIIEEDEHERWPASFSDEFNHRRAHDVDAIYRRHILRVSGEADDAGLVGRTDVLTTSANSLSTPTPTSTFTVHAHQPPHASETPLPIILLMNGQFLESSDLLEQLDHAMSEGVLPPALLVMPGDRHNGRTHTAWGWRNAYGPHDLAPYLRHELLPELAARYALTDEIHLLSWDYTAYATLRTALAVQSVTSVTLFEPSEVARADTGGFGFWDQVGLDAMARAAAWLLDGGRLVQLSELTRRTNRHDAPQASEDLAARVAALTSRPLPRVALPDPNIVSAASAAVSALAHALKRV